MDNFFIIIATLVEILVTFIFTVILNTLFGLLSGWVVGLFFGKTILGILASIGIEGFAMWQIGTFLGFLTSFFKYAFTFRDNWNSLTQHQEKQN